ncbi:MAG: XRE family transcriptional regulator [Candidatus Melainabacteria bacterium]|nr:XRE family transcriptional regulator [Candidatus Melainabacteria bacterium]
MPYGKRLQKFWDSLPENEKEEIKRESEALRTEYNSLQEIRRELELSQQDVANSMGVKQVSISKLENRDDMKISTLKEYCEAMGAKVKIVVVIKNKEFELNAFNHTDKQLEII